MIILPKQPVNERSIVYNERTDFTRRIPTYLSKKQLYRDSKIAARIIHLYDIEHDYEGTIRYFIEKSHLLSNPRYWELMRTVWIGAGSNFFACTFRELMKSNRPAKSWFMTPEDKAYFDALPEEITLYRAVDSHCKLEVDENITDFIFAKVSNPIDLNTIKDVGISWSLNHDFCVRYAEINGLIVKSKTFKKSECFAYISRRGEMEIIVL